MINATRNEVKLSYQVTRHDTGETYYNLSRHAAKIIRDTLREFRVKVTMEISEVRS